MFDRKLGISRPANDLQIPGQEEKANTDLPTESVPDTGTEPVEEPADETGASGFDLEAAIDHCVQPGAQGFVRAVFLSDRATQLMDEGDLDGAIAGFQAALASCPDGWYAGNLQVLLGNACQVGNRLDQALAAYDRALALDCSAPAEAYRRRSFVHSAQGRFDAALADMRRAVVEGEDPAFAAAKLCAIHLVMGNPVAAVAAAAETAETETGAVKYRLEQMQSRAEARLLLGDRVGAIADLAGEAALAEGDDPDLALWRYVIRRRAGLAGLTAQIDGLIGSVGVGDRVGVFRRWFVHGDADARDQVTEKLEAARGRGQPLAAIAECYYLLGAEAECRGDRAAAFRCYTIATADIENAWRIEYALAQYGLQRVAAQTGEPGA